MTKHELLEFIFIYEPVTRKDIEEYFGISESRVKRVVSILRDRGWITRLKKERPERLVITRTGIKQLNYYTENGCTIKTCSCHENE